MSITRLSVFFAIIFLFIPLSVANPALPTVGLIGHWTLDSVNNGITEDSSNNLINGIVTGATSSMGYIGQALSFDGNDFIGMGDVSQADNLGAMTVSVWVKAGVADGESMYIVGKSKGVTNANGWALWRGGTSDTFRFNVGTGVTTQSESVTFRDTQWHHVVGWWDGQTMQIYVDGVPSDSTPPTKTGTIPDVTPPLCVGTTSTSGACSTSTTSMWNGLIDDVRIYNRALSQSEILDLYNNNTGGTGVVDNEPPTISLTNIPSIVSGTVNFNATSSDNVGISGVRFMLDGVSIGSEDTTSPYSISWNSIFTTNGVHDLTAISKDYSGNISTSSPISITISNNQLNDSLVMSGFDVPTTLVFAPNGNLLVGEKGGTIRVVKDGQLLATPFIDIPLNFINSSAGEVFDSDREKGLLGITFHPDFNSDSAKRYVYVYYTLSKSSLSSVNRVSRFNVVGDFVDINSGQTVILDNIPAIAGNHNSGWISFGPDKKLYIAVGDGGGFENRWTAQRLDSLNGKIHRVNDDGTIPSDNPTINEMQYVDPLYNPSGTVKRGEIWAMGFRNPWRCRFSELGTLLCADVGQSQMEEVDLVLRGKNYGWGFLEGTNCYDNPCPSSLTYPIYTYGRNEGASITGGDFGAKTNFGGNYESSYIFADYVEGWIKSIQLDQSGTEVVGLSQLVKPAVAGESEYITDLIAGPDGSIYYNNIALGTIRKLFSSGTNTAPVVVVNTDPSPSQGQAPLTVQFSSVGTYDIDGDGLLYSWNFGDGNVSQEANPTHTYINGGSYTATLMVSENKQNPLSSTKSVNIIVGSQPIINYLSPQDGSPFTMGSTINLFASSTDAIDGTLPSSAYEWKIDMYHNNDNPHTHPYINSLIGDVQNFTTMEMSSDPDAMDHFYRITLTVTNSFGVSSQRVVFIHPVVFNSVPTISSIVDQSINKGSTTQSLIFNVSDQETQPSLLIVKATSSNPTLVPEQSIVLGGVDGSRNITINPVPTESGTAQITLSVSDGVNVSQTSFNLTVLTPESFVPGLISHWTLDSITNGITEDISGNGINGSVIGATSTLGHIGQALLFDGVNDLVSIGDVSQTDNLEAITVSTWVKPSIADGGTLIIVGKSKGSVPSNGWVLWRGGSDETYRFTVGTASVARAESTMFRDTLWHHVVGTYDGSRVQVYVDGVASDPTPPSLTGTIPNITPHLCIGATSTSGSCSTANSMWNGIIDDVRIYNRALTIQEIQQLYQQ